MATPPLVTAADAQAAIERITDRRRQIDDPNAWRLSDDPLEVLAYLRKYSGGLSQKIIQADIHDGLTLRFHLWWLGVEAELWLLERAQQTGVPPQDLRQLLGINTQQGLRDRIRLDRQKMSTYRNTPHPALAPPPPPQQVQDAEQEWLDSHRDDILAVAVAALEYRDLADDAAAEWLVEVARDVRDKTVTPGSLMALRVALVDLSASPAVQQQESSHPLQLLLDRWAHLLHQYEESRDRAALAGVQDP